MENGDDLLRIFLSKRSLLNNESFDNLPSSRNSSARTYRMGDVKELHTTNGYVTYSDSEADKLMQYRNLVRSRIHFEEGQNGYAHRPSSDGSFKYISRSSDQSTETNNQININTIEKLNLGECNSTITTDSVDSVNSAKPNDRHDEDRFSLDSFNECYPKQIISRERISKKRISPIDEISENSMNSAKLKEYFAQKEKEKLAEEKDIQRIILEAQRMTANRPVSRKKSNYDFLRNANCPRNGQKLQQNNYILFYNEFFETSSTRGDNQSDHTLDNDSCNSSSSSCCEKRDVKKHDLWRPSSSRADLLDRDELNISIATSSSAPSCCCVKLFKSWFCRSGRAEKKSSVRNKESSKIINKKSSKSNSPGFHDKKEI